MGDIRRSLLSLLRVIPAQLMVLLVLKHELLFLLRGDLLTVSQISGPSEDVSWIDWGRGSGRAEGRHSQGDVG